MPNIGPLELAIVVVIVLLLVGTARLPGVAKSLGSGIREFKDSVTGDRHDAPEEPPAKPERSAADRSSKDA